MKNTFSYLIASFVVNFLFIGTGYCQPMTNDAGWPCVETSNSDFDQVCDAYRYVSLGEGPIILIPNLGIGYRARHGQFGSDAAVSFSTIGFAHQLSVHLVGHYYLNPLQKTSAYLGLGLMGSGISTNRKIVGGTLSPDFVFGKELGGGHFIETHIAIPSLWMDSKHIYSTFLPLMYFKYGTSF